MGHEEISPESDALRAAKVYIENFEPAEPKKLEGLLGQLTQHELIAFIAWQKERTDQKIEKLRAH